MQISLNGISINNNSNLQTKVYKKANDMPFLGTELMEKTLQKISENSAKTTLPHLGQNIDVKV